MMSNSNNTSIWIEEDESERVSREVAFATYFLCTFLTILSNSANLTIFHRLQKKEYTIARVFYTSLSCADLLVGVTQIFQLHAVWIGYWPYDDWLCRIESGLYSTFLALSIIMILFTSIDRYFAISHPYEYKAWVTEKLAVCMVVSTWSVMLTWTVVAAYLLPLGADFYNYVWTVRICAYNLLEGMREHLVYSIIANVTVFGFNSLMISLFSLRTLHIALKQYARIHAEINQHSQATDSAVAGTIINLKAIRSLGAVIIVFYISWGPYLVYQHYLYFMDLPPTHINYWVSFIGYCNSFMNSFIYFTVNSNYRTELKKLLRLQ